MSQESNMAAKMNPDLLRERQNATFNPEQLTYFLYGGQKKVDRRRELENIVFSSEAFNGPDYRFLGRSDVYSEGIRKTTEMVKMVRELGLHDPQELYWLRSAIFPNEAPPTDLHTGMFLPTIMNQSSPEQQQRWLHHALTFNIIGTYAQTEMGHGTFLRGLETTANYDIENQEFVLHSPTLTSTKWWPGGLGKTSNHAIVMADLRIKGRSYGMHSFMVQLRDLNSHEPLPGISLGDIGPKFGYDMIDNGFLRMNHVRIPLNNMLMKNAQVLPDGTYMKSKHPKLVYGTMVFIRSVIVSDVAGKGLAQAAVIATRYSAVRHQSELQPGAPEPQVLDYQTQQYKVLPELAKAYAYFMAGNYISRHYFEVNSRIEQGDVDSLPELHALSAALKAYTTFGTASGVEACRMACGGHGYSQASGIPKIYHHSVPGCTYEGENTVMFLQTARFLVKMQGEAKRGGKLPPSVSYLARNDKRPCSLDSSLHLHSLVDAFQHRAQRMVSEVTEMYEKLLAAGLPKHDAWNNCSVHLVKAAEAHVEYSLVEIFVNQVERAPAAMRTVLTHVCQLFSVHTLLHKSGDFLMDKYMSAEQVAAVSHAELDLLAKIRPNAVALADAFDFHDSTLQSVLGRYDGNVYENLYKWAKDSPLNKNEVHESFNKYMKPFQRASKL